MPNKKHDKNHEKQDAAPKKDHALFSDETLEKQEAVETTIRQLEADLQQATDRMLRAHAELDNYRKRVNREMDEIRKFATIDLIRDMLPVWDNMSRALEAAEKTEDVNTLKEGVQLMFEQFTKILKQHHCLPIEAMGQPFDPNIHEAISQFSNPDVPAGNIMFESQAGFKLHDRIVRPSQVVISTGPGNV